MLLLGVFLCLQIRTAFFLARKLIAASVCPARPFIKSGNPGVKDGLRVTEESVVSQRKKGSKEQKYTYIYIHTHTHICDL